MAKAIKIKILYLAGVLVIVLWLYSLTQIAQAVSSNVTPSTDIQPVISMNLSPAIYNFGDITAGVPKRGSEGVTVGVTTSSANGYTLSIADNVAGTDSAFLHTDTTTRIPDFTDGTIATPVHWSTGSSLGLGLTVYGADTSKEAKWGTGTTFDDQWNKYAGVPENSDIIHNASGYKAAEDHTEIALIVDVENSQKNGVYSGDITFTATADLF